MREEVGVSEEEEEAGMVEVGTREESAGMEEVVTSEEVDKGTEEVRTREEDEERTREEGSFSSVWLLLIFVIKSGLREGQNLSIVCHEMDQNSSFLSGVVSNELDE
jgi:hypothetical protein